MDKEKGTVVLRSSQKDRLIDEMERNLGEDTRKVHTTIRPTVIFVTMILSATPNLEEISCPPSLYERVPDKIGKALDKLGIRFVPRMLSPGRPQTHPKWKVQKIFALEAEGMHVKEICEITGLPLTTVYYYLKKGRL